MTHAAYCSGGRPCLARGRWRLFGWFAFLFLSRRRRSRIVISPPDRDMGDLQKIMYVHVPAAWMTMLAPLDRPRVRAALSVEAARGRRSAGGLGGRGRRRHLPGSTLVLGMIWARPTWGVWWTWDARLTSTLVLFLMLAGYLALRALVDDPRAARAVERGGGGARRDQRAHRLHVGALVAHDPPDPIESSDGRSGVRDRPSSECVRVSVRDDLLHSPPVRRRAHGARGGACAQAAALGGGSSNALTTGCSSAPRSPSTWAVVIGYFDSSAADAAVARASASRRGEQAEALDERNDASYASGGRHRRARDASSRRSAI